MKNTIIVLLALNSVTSFAHTIVGTTILKGSIKTQITVETLKTTCRVKIDKVRNLKVEDSFGNPGYTVQTIVTLDASDFERNLYVNFKQNITFTNLFTVGTGTEVRDLEFKSDSGSETMKIDLDGRIKSVNFNYKNQKISCNF